MKCDQNEEKGYLFIEHSGIYYLILPEDVHKNEGYKIEQ